MKTPGESVPNTSFKVRENNDWVTWTSDDVFKGKTVVVFALPGAFTPTCSSTHLPGYMTLSSQIRSQGVDEILCLSVNDSFVMNAWAMDQGVDDEVRMLPDGGGHFTRGMGLLVNKDDLGFGNRSWRYAMLVEDGIIQQMFVEDRNAPGDPFEVSDAMTMLDYLSKRERTRAAE